jgi:phage baseplate assembly protein W
MPDDANLLTDIRLVLLDSRLRPVYAVDSDRRRVPTQPGWLADLGVVSGRDNLGQAVILRLLTPRGELASLGHPDYGSRLHELIGQPNTETNRNLVKLFILESLHAESRIEKVVRVTVEAAPGTRDRVNVQLAVKPVGDSTPVTIGPFTLELGP